MCNVVGFEPEYSLWDYFKRSLKNQPEHNFLGVKELGKDGVHSSNYKWITYG
jgi:hypothetical protein